MSTYEGGFIVINNTGGQITSCVVTHATTDYGPNTFGPATLANGATSSPPTFLKTSTSNKDRWSVSFVGANNQLYTGQENCGFESEDNGGTVRVVLNPEDWDIYMPKSSPCTDNDYDQT